MAHHPPREMPGSAYQQTGQSALLFSTHRPFQLTEIHTTNMSLAAKNINCGFERTIRVAAAAGGCPQDLEAKRCNN